MTYAEKLKDPRWQKKRLEIMQRDKFKCTWCSDESNTLNVHHLRYINGNDPWEYDGHYLITLCEKCHEQAHFEIETNTTDPTFDIRYFTDFMFPRFRRIFNKIEFYKGDTTVFLRDNLSIMDGNRIVRAIIYLSILKKFIEINGECSLYIGNAEGCGDGNIFNYINSSDTKYITELEEEYVKQGGRSFNPTKP